MKEKPNAKELRQQKGILSAENTLYVALVTKGRREVRVYIKGCYSCGSRFQAGRSDSLTCSSSCKSALSRRLSHGHPPLIRFDKKDKLTAETVGELSGYKKKRY